MNVFDMFRPQQQAAPAAQPNAPVPNMGPSGTGPLAPTGDATQQQNQNQQQQQQQEPKSPLADFTDFWKDTPLADGEQAQPNWDDPSSIVPGMKIDPKKMFEAAQRIDFAKVMPAEKVKAALAGDAVAFGDCMNAVVHSAYANMAMSTSRIVEASLKQMAPKLFAALPSHIRKHVVSDTVNTDNPIFQDPAVAPMLEMVKSQMQMKFPKASAKEISDKAKQYVSGFAETVTKSGKAGTAANNPRTGKPLEKKGTGNEDWSDFFVGDQSAQQ